MTKNLQLGEAPELATKTGEELLDLAGFKDSDAPSMDNVLAIREILRRGDEAEIKQVKKIMSNRFHFLVADRGKSYINHNDAYLYRYCYEYQDKLPKMTGEAVSACTYSMYNLINSIRVEKFAGKGSTDDICQEIGLCVFEKLGKYDPERYKITTYFYNDITDKILMEIAGDEKKYAGRVRDRVGKARQYFQSVGIENPSMKQLAEWINQQKYARETSAHQLENNEKRTFEFVYYNDLPVDIPSMTHSPEQEFIEKETASETAEKIASAGYEDMQEIVKNYVGVMHDKPGKLNKTALYRFAFENGMTTLSKNQFSHEYHKFERNLRRKFGINPNFPENDAKKKAFNATTGFAKGEIEEDEKDIIESADMIRDQRDEMERYSDDDGKTETYIGLA